MEKKIFFQFGQVLVSFQSKFLLVLVVYSYLLQFRQNPQKGLYIYQNMSISYPSPEFQQLRQVYFLFTFSSDIFQRQSFRGKFAYFQYPPKSPTRLFFLLNSLKLRLVSNIQPGLFLLNLLLSLKKNKKYFQIFFYISKS